MPSTSSKKAAPPTSPPASQQIVSAEPGSTEELIRRLHQVYMQYVKPLEEMYKYDVFRPSWFEETLLSERPFVSFFGPWSAGKTTFINYLLQDNYLWTGPQPTTAEFTAVMHGEEPGPLDGRVLVSSKNLPFKGLNEFGEAFLSNFQGFQAPHPLLKRVTLIDTPGVLESAKEVHERKYDYVRLSRWFAERSDLIFVLFDPTKLDAGAELRALFKNAFTGVEGKVRIVLNKADSVSTQELMRVYGSLFWNLSNIINTTEPPRVYVGSFWDRPYQEGTFTLLFSEEKADLLYELMETVPQQARDKKVALLIRRAKEVLTHAVIVGGMRSDLPHLFGKEKAKRKAMENLPRTYEVVGAKYKMNYRDFPPVSEYRTFLEKFDIEKFPELEKAEKAGLIDGIRQCIDTILPGMLCPVKNVSAADPRDPAEREKLHKLYYDSVRLQYEGKEGKQGSSDLVITSLRPPVVAGGGGVSGTATRAVSSAAASSKAISTTTPPIMGSAPAGQQVLMNQMMQMMQSMMASQMAQQWTNPQVGQQVPPAGGTRPPPAAQGPTVAPVPATALTSEAPPVTVPRRAAFNGDSDDSDDSAGRADGSVVTIVKEREDLSAWDEERFR